MESVLGALNHLLETRLIEKYAIGGAIGAPFYIEALEAVLQRHGLRERASDLLPLHFPDGIDK